MNCPRFRFYRAGEVVRAGGVIAYPTEAVYGLGCDPGDEDAVATILAIKRRSVEAGLILIAADVEQLNPWINPTAGEAEHLAQHHKAPVTWIVTADRYAPYWITGGRPRIAVRVTQHPIAAGLCRHAGTALVSTSANRSGHPPARTALKVRKLFGSALDLVVGGAAGPHAKPSEIRDAATGQVLRPG